MVVLKSLMSVGLLTTRYSNTPFKGNVKSSAGVVMMSQIRALSRQALSKSLELVTVDSVKSAGVVMMSQIRALSRQALSKSLELVTADSVKVTQGRLVNDTPRPLVVLLSWMLAQKKHINKYCEFYVNRGCNVLTISITPWQLLFPVTGSQVVADEVLSFLDQNSTNEPLFVHGFSVGGYVWGEVMVKMKQDLERYEHIVNRIIGQAWDSAADVTELQVGLPLAVFPRNPIMRLALGKYIGYHLKVCDDIATKHYIRSSQMFHTTLVHRPALLLLSKTDPVGSITSNLRLKETWESMGIKVTWKCWDDSKHVSHYLKYKDEYIETLENFLDNIKKDGEKDQIQNEEDLRRKLQAKL